MLKANFYGLGALPAAERLLSEGCRHFFVAHLAEALALRPVVGGSMVAVLNGLLPGDEALCSAADIWPVLGSVEEVGRWATHGRTLGRRLPALLHVDTGMSRLGLPPEELRALLDHPSPLDCVDLRYLMTHLLDAERPQARANERQRAAFLTAREMRPDVPATFANSSGLFLGAGFASDLARAGAALAGINPTPHAAHPLRPVASLGARVLQLRTIPAGETVGYGGTWTAARTTRVATVGIGYADGWPLALTNRGRAHFDGCDLPLVGRVSMDLTTFDATDAPGVRVGSMVELIGPAIPAERVAADANTSPYEILTRLGPRIVRAYHG